MLAGKHLRVLAGVAQCNGEGGHKGGRDRRQGDGGLHEPPHLRCALREIVALRPDWHSDDDTLGKFKIVMTGSASDPQAWQAHLGGKLRRDLLAKRAKDPNDALKMVIVRDMWLTQEEIAFYDALADNQSAVEVLGNDQLRIIAHELLTSLKSSITIDWAHRDSARARLRVLVKRILRKYGYPPDLQDAAVQEVLQQAEALSAQWAA
ncbi:MAG: DUF3387 domain-containing protein [Phaeovulum sp.]|uniref:type I restriction enzyme endonuclease domain-containing protein n=1 Tax=Phaeovulum sp. TaxID=2934796 RepID=UPI002736AD94|nr:type I restriction enzyme endonuclease domain-containing protein [Phaeovulum sp.]MDP3860546.1 DUF3387 domain-containing protein [Phaeovulum sp.]